MGFKSIYLFGNGDFCTHDFFWHRQNQKRPFARLQKAFTKKMYIVFVISGTKPITSKTKVVA